MKTYLSVLFILISLSSYGEVKKEKVSDRDAILNKIKNKNLKKEVEEAEIRALRKSKIIEQELLNANKNNKVVDDFFEFKKSITTKKVINGEEFVVLKDMEVLKNEFIKKRDKVLDAYKKGEMKADAIAPAESEDLPIQYPLPESKTVKFITYKTAAHYAPRGIGRPIQSSNQWMWITGLILFLVTGLFILYKKKARTK